MNRICMRYMAIVSCALCVVFTGGCQEEPVVPLDQDAAAAPRTSNLMVMTEDVHLDPAATDRAIREATRTLHNFTGADTPTGFVQRQSSAQER